MLPNTKYFTVQKNGLSPCQVMLSYLGGSAFQTIVDNPITAYRQLVQQYAKDLEGNSVSPRLAEAEARAVFRRTPINASLSGLGPRLVGVGFKRIPKFGTLLAISFFVDKNAEPGLLAATGASILSAPMINPIRMIEKQQRASFRQTGTQKPIVDILRDSAAKNYRPLFRGTVPLMGHSLASATTGLVGQPQLQKYIHQHLAATSQLSTFATGLVASAAVSPIYVLMTNPLSRLEVIMQTSSIQGNGITLAQACKEMVADASTFGLRGVFRGQGLGIAKAILSLTLFHEGRIWCTEAFRKYNL
jgi:hypothetical protein